MDRAAPGWQIALYYWLILGLPPLLGYFRTSHSDHQVLSLALLGIMLVASVIGSSFLALIMRAMWRRQAENSAAAKTRHIAGGAWVDPLAAPEGGVELEGRNSVADAEEEDPAILGPSRLKSIRTSNWRQRTFPRKRRRRRTSRPA